jgi:hypothetical protein
VMGKFCKRFWTKIVCQFSNLLLVLLALIPKPGFATSLERSSPRSDNAQLLKFGEVYEHIKVSSFTKYNISFVERALANHKVVIFRNQSELSLQSFQHFTSLLGELHIHLDNSIHVSGYPAINLVSNAEEDIGKSLRGVRVEKFHSELSW